MNSLHFLIKRNVFIRFHNNHKAFFYYFPFDNKHMWCITALVMPSALTINICPTGMWNWFLSFSLTFFISMPQPNRNLLPLITNFLYHFFKRCYKFSVLLKYNHYPIFPPSSYIWYIHIQREKQITKATYWKNYGFVCPRPIYICAYKPNCPL